MTSQGFFPARSPPRSSEPQDTVGWAPRPRLAPRDIPALLWRERWLMLAVFIVVAVVGVGFSFTLKTIYGAHSSVLVRLGQEYVYEPRAGDAGRGAVPDNDSILQSETEILQSDQLRMRVVQRLGVARLSPGDARAFAHGSAEDRELIVERLAAGIGKGLKIDTAPATPVIRLTYESTDPQLSAQVLNTLLEEYLLYRRTVLLTPNAGALDDQRQASAHDALAALTDREREVAALLPSGMSNAEIGARTYCSESTVKAHLSRAMAKLGIASRTQLAVLVDRASNATDATSS